jgi:hypothetical protein
MHQYQFGSLSNVGVTRLWRIGGWRLPKFVCPPAIAVQVHVSIFFVMEVGEGSRARPLRAWRATLYHLTPDR